MRTTPPQLCPDPRNGCRTVPLKNVFPDSLSRADAGRCGEDLVATFLKRWGYAVLGRNLRFLGSEIDILARKDAVLYIVEAKVRSRFPSTLEEVISRAKKAALIRGAKAIQSRQKSTWDGIRFDLALITRSPPVLHYFADIIRIDKD